MRSPRVGHYPEAPQQEGHRAGRPRSRQLRRRRSYIFVAAERASLIGVYKDTGAEPEFVQLLPSGIGPEGLVAIPSRNLLATANEADLVEDGARRARMS